MQTIKQALKVVVTCLFLAVWGTLLFLFIALGVVALVVCDFFRKQARQVTAGLNGERWSKPYAPPVQMPYMVMDADGFVEPPSDRAVTFHAASRPGSSVAPSFAAAFAPRAQLRLAPPTAALLPFHSDPAARARLAARRPLSRSLTVSASAKVVSLSQFRPSRKS